MSEADSSDVGNSPDCGCDGGKASVPDRFSSCAIAKFLNEIRSRTSDGVDLNALEKAEETFDASLQSKAEGMLDGKLQEALEIADDPNEVASLLDSLKNWIERFAQKLRPSAFEGLTTVFRMMSATLSGEYTGFSKSSFVALVGCALYCVSPIDVIPDAIPIFGLVDDAFILGLTLKKIASELETFRRWERLKSARSILACYLPYFNDVKRVILAPGWLSEDDDCSDVIETLRPVYPNAAFERFSWLSNKPWQDARDYIDGQGARDLLNFVREGGDMATVALVGHSLGARLVVRALARLAEESPKKPFWARKPSNRIGQAFLLGAAIDADDPDLKLATGGVNAPLCNFFNRADRVLSYVYRIAEQKTPLGLSGNSELRDNYYDCVLSGHEEYWLSAVGNVGSILSLLQSKTLISKFSLAECAAAGLPEYGRHEFDLYARFFRESVVLPDETQTGGAAEPA